MSKKKKNPPVLTGKQARFLRGLGHHLEPAVMIGREGVSDPVLASLEDSLTAHELVKVKIQQTCPNDRFEVGELLSREAAAAIVQTLGKTILLYRPNKDMPSDRAIHLP
jgi:RNA-binding protein